MQNPTRIYPIYTSRGALGGFLAFPYIFSPAGEWIGWVETDRKVFSVNGHFVGTLTSDPRILRQREWGYDEAKRKPPKAPAHLRVPSLVPLAPQMSEIPLNMIDVLEEAPELMPPVGFGDLVEDME